MTRRPSVSKTDLAKVAVFLNDVGARVASVEVQPGRVIISTTDMEDVVLPGKLRELELGKEKWTDSAPRSRRQ